jgi:hypothetical protein
MAVNDWKAVVVYFPVENSHGGEYLEASVALLSGRE